MKKKKKKTWVWLYYPNEMRGVFGDIPALDVVKIYDVRLFCV